MVNAQRRRWLVGAVLAGCAVIAACSGTAELSGELPSTSEPLVIPPPTITALPTTAPVIAPTPVPAPTPTPTPTFTGWVNPDTVGQNVGTKQGLLTFRGNPTRTFYGQGPVPQAPQVQWRFGSGKELCSFSVVGGEESEWCGTGWTGQPAVFDYDGQRWVVFGSFAPAVHFLDASTGERIIADYPVGDLIKGSVTIDPDEFPLVYFGSRDGFYRVVAFDGGGPRELWRLGANDTGQPTLWNDDWDGPGVIIDDYLFIGGENSRLHIVKLNRGFDASGAVTVEPELVFDAAGWDDELLQQLGDTNVSIETAITVVGDTLWFANSGGLIQAWDISGLKDGVEPTRVLRFWTGDDVDASVVIDAEGFAYVGVEYERGFSRALELGQLVKLDPRRPDDPVVWSRQLQVRLNDGIWATPAIHQDVLYVPTSEGNLHAIDRESGATRWQVKLPGPVWSSPVVVDDVLIQADCSGVLRAWDVADTNRAPEPLWTIAMPWCVESTPAVWDGQIFVGHRRGELWAIADEG